MRLEINHHNLILTIILGLSTAIIFGLASIAIAPSAYINNAQQKQQTYNNSLSTSEEKEISIIFAGDIMLSRQVNSMREKNADYSWPLRNVSDYLNQADLVVANLESPFIKNLVNYEVLTGSFIFKANPLAIEGLKLANIGLLSLANNHSLNQGQKGIIDTIDILNENNIFHVGAGRNKQEARAPAITTINEQNFSFLAYAYPDDNSVANNNYGGIANMDIEEMINDVKNIKNSSTSTIIILMHAGTEYTTEPNWQQKEFAKAAIDAGADMVVGHHPHWPQIFEFYKNKPIIYSLGNFVFDQMWSEETRQGLLLQATWQNDLKRLELIPIKISDYGQPKIIEPGEERNKILEKIGANDSGIIYKNNE